MNITSITEQHPHSILGAYRCWRVETTGTKHNVAYVIVELAHTGELDITATGGTARGLTIGEEQEILRRIDSLWLASILGQQVNQQ